MERSMCIKDGRESTRITDLDTSTDATVYLDMRSHSNTVTATLRNGVSGTLTYIYGVPRIEKTRGTGQKGVAGGRLEKEIGVRVLDGGDNRIPGLEVKFAGDADDDH